MADEDLGATLAEMRGYITSKLAAGFDPPADVITSAVEMFCDDAEPEVLTPIAERLTREAVSAHLKDQSNWPAVTDCDRLDEAMAELNRNGIVCRQDFSCCGNCGVAEIGYEIDTERSAGLEVRGYAFYHMQDTEAAAEGRGLHLNYGAAEPGEAAALDIGREIVAALQHHGLKTRWNGRWDTRIKVMIDWKRRLPHGG